MAVRKTHEEQLAEETAARDAERAKIDSGIASIIEAQKQIREQELQDLK